MSMFNVTSWEELSQLDLDNQYSKKDQYLQGLYDIILALNGGATFETITNLLLEKLIELSQEKHVYITEINPESEQLVYIAGSGLYKKSLGFSQNVNKGINGEAWKKVGPIYIEDYQSYEHRLSDKEFQSIQSVVVLPLITKDKMIGTVGFAAEYIKPFDTISIDLLNNFIQLASTAIDNAQLHSKLREKNSQFEALHTVSLNTINRLDATELYRSLIGELIQLLGFGEAFLCIVEKENNSLRCVADTMLSSVQGTTINYGEGLAGKVWATQEALFIEDYQTYNKKIDIAPFKVKSIACIPLKNNNEIIGILGIASHQSFNFDSNFKFTVQAFAELASIAIINSQAFQELELKTKESELLEQTQKVIANKLDLSELCQSVTESITDIFSYSSALIVKVRETEPLLLSSSGSPISIENNHLVETLIKTQEPQFFDEVTENSTISHLLRPLIINNNFFGFLYVKDDLKSFTVQDKNILHKVCQQLEVALENAELHGRVKKDLIRSEAFYKVSKTIQTHKNLSDITTDIVEICRDALAARWAVIYRIDQDIRTVKAHARAQVSGETPLKILDYDSLMHSFTGWVMKHQDSVLSNNFSNDSKGHEKSRHIVNNGGSAIVVPLLHQGQSLGSLGFVNKKTDHVFTEGDLKLAENVANQAAVAIIQHELSHQLEHQAYHDSLTNLPNRAFFEEQLELALNNLNGQNKKPNKHMAVMFLDLDGFKHVNDTLGHDIGDSLLQIVAKRLNYRTRDKDTIARLGGDEFGIIISELPSKEKVFGIAENILQCFKEPFSVNGHSLQISTSIGISLFPEDGHDAQSLLKHADSAMYAAKNNGKNNIRRFVPELAIAAQKRLEIESDLTKALKENEFELYYQPKISLTTGQWIGAEALIRWNHPEKGFISPGDFIPIAEEGNTIIDIGNWVLNEACQQLAIWRSKGHPPISIAINISSLHFEHPKLISKIESTLKKYQMDAKLLELEVTESVVMQDVDLVIKRLNQLKSMGITIAIDDFGTGYSSLQYLNKLPLNTLKIDKSFIDEIVDGTQSPLVMGILTLAQSLGLETVAEGVETIEQVEFLKLFGCSQAQGFYFAKPLTAQSFWEQYTIANQSETNTLVNTI